MPAEIIDVAEDLWLWRTAHPRWIPGEGWDPMVTSTSVRSGGQSIVIDPLAPAPADEVVWARIDAAAPDAVVVLKPEHVRDVDLFVRRYGARAFGPDLFPRDGAPRAELELIEPGSELPGGLIALYDGRGRGETPAWLPAQRGARVRRRPHRPRSERRAAGLGDAVASRARPPALTELLTLPPEHVIVSHGAPGHDRGAFERALRLPPWQEGQEAVS